MAVKRRYFRCPQCDKVSYFHPGEAVACRRCGAGPGATQEAQGAAQTGQLERRASGDGRPGPGGPASGGRADVGSRRDPASTRMLAGVSIGSAVLAFMLLWGTPFALLLSLAAVATGGVALAQAEGDETTTTMAAIGTVVGALVLVLVVILLFTWDATYTGSSWTYEGGSSGREHEGSSGGGSAGGDGGGSGGTGGGGGSGGTGGGGTGGGGSVETPGIAIPSVIAALVLAAWGRRR